MEASLPLSQCIELTRNTTKREMSYMFGYVLYK